MLRNLSQQEWIGVAIAAAWGALLALVPGNGAMFAVPVLGPPVAYLVLRKRPLLSWQIPVITASICEAVQDRNPHGPYTEGSVWTVILSLWQVLSLFSVPWAYVFQRRMQSEGEKHASLATAAKMFGAGSLIFLVCGTILLGFALCFYQASNPNASFFDRWFGAMMVTAGITLTIYICRHTTRRGPDFQIESLFGWVLAPPAVVVGRAVVSELWEKFYRPTLASTSTLSDLPIYTASLEGLAVVIWLQRRGRRMKRMKASAGAGIQA